MLAKFLSLALSLGILILLLACSVPAPSASSASLPSSQSPASGSAATDTKGPAVDAAIQSIPPSAPESSLKYPGGVPLDAAEIERWIAVFTQEERVAAFLPSLAIDSEIAAIAKAHSENMVRTGEVSNTLDGKDSSDRAREAGYHCKKDLGGGRLAFGLAGNVIMHPRVKRWEKTSYGPFVSYKPIGYGADSKAVARAIVSSWMDDLDIRSNILKPRYRSIGVGASVYVFEKENWARETVYATLNLSSCG